MADKESAGDEVQDAMPDPSEMPGGDLGRDATVRDTQDAGGRLAGDEPREPSGDRRPLSDQGTPGS